MSEQTVDQTNEFTVLEENVSFDDFLVRYQGQAVEWHSGKVVRKLSNNEVHQALQMFLSFLLRYFLSTKKLGKIYTDGYQMQLNDDKPVRQPDLLIVFNKNKERIQHQYLDGPADVVIEIISPATRTIDRGAKYYQYQDGGVQEYWIVDPISKRVDVYYLDENHNFQPIVLTDNKITSRQLIGFKLDVNILWQDELPDGVESVVLVQEMLM